MMVFLRFAVIIYMAAIVPKANMLNLDIDNPEIGTMGHEKPRISDQTRSRYNSTLMFGKKEREAAVKIRPTVSDVGSLPYYILITYSDCSSGRGHETVT